MYAHMDKRDDVAAGVRSSARAFGDHSKPTLAALAAAQLGLLTSAGYLAGSGKLQHHPLQSRRLYVCVMCFRVSCGSGLPCSVCRHADIMRVCRFFTGRPPVLRRGSRWRRSASWMANQHCGPGQLRQLPREVPQQPPPGGVGVAGHRPWTVAFLTNDAIPRRAVDFERHFFTFSLFSSVFFGSISTIKTLLSSAFL